MKFSVIWEKSAEDHLAELWLAATDKEAIRSASDRIDVLLANDPSSVGESRVSNFRILFETPLAVLYDVKPSDRKVKVWAVWRSSK
jgi:hypothetical protein